jgi:general secretion pathway protein E
MLGTATAAASPNDPRSAAFAERFGAFLKAQAGLADPALSRAERAMRETGERFDLVLTRLGLVPEGDMARLAAQFLGRAFITAGEMPDVPLDIEGLDPAYLKQAGIVPVREDGETLVIATGDPFQTDSEAALSYLLGRPVIAAVAAERDIARTLERHYRAGGEPAGYAVPGAQSSDRASDRARDDDVRRLADLASEAPVVRLVHDTIVRAVEARASDIHLEPTDGGLMVRLRIDGLLETTEVLPEQMAAAVLSRVKIMARLDIAERRLPQDGRIKVNVRGREVDLRVATMPTLRGETVVLRILDRTAIVLDFATLGFDGAMLDAFLDLIEKPNGLILVTGPTGSGKSTTLYTALSRLNRPDRKTFTIEDPVEFQLAGVSQVQVQPRIGLTFASALRSILRQDPDVIMVGEIRDLETAQMAIQSALTGHLVLSTLHTNSAAATIARLIDMGIDDYMIASTLKGTLAQRLVRRLCPDCATPAEPTPALLACLDGAGLRAGASLDGVRAPVGCPACRSTGFRGRLAVCELLPVTTAVAEAIVGRGDETAIETAAMATGLPTMMADGLTKVLAGATTLDDVLRVTRAI